MSEPLRHRLLAGQRHGFGTRAAVPPAGCVRARQVHGVEVARITGDAPPGEADALVGAAPGVIVGVATADCVPILVADRAGSRVAAVHAGWRGLAAGVIPAALEALLGEGCALGSLTAVVGPHIGACCYEVDAPVLDALAPRFGEALDASCVATRPGHVRLDLGRLARHELRSVLEESSLGAVPGCTHCDEERFHSYRRDGAGAGRLVHWIATSGALTGARSDAST